MEHGMEYEMEYGMEYSISNMSHELCVCRKVVTVLDLYRLQLSLYTSLHLSRHLATCT